MLGVVLGPCSLVRKDTASLQPPANVIAAIEPRGGVLQQATQRKHQDLRSKVVRVGLRESA